MSSRNPFSLSLGAMAIALLFTAPAGAQMGTATIRGHIRSGGEPVPAGLTVVAVNRETGFTYKAKTEADGGYAITQLPPGEYEIQVNEPAGVAKSEPITVFVGDSAAVDLGLARQEAAESITVAGSRQRRAVKTSELATTVPQKLVEALPQASHNFLTSVDLAPGVMFQQDQATGNTTIQAGAQNHDNVNVFIDGFSQKNQILRGGLVGQDSTRGNPFPQSAVREYKVITQNYKAEYDQVSSVAITAATKSGTNNLHGDVYFDRAQTSWRAMTPFEIQKTQEGEGLMPSNKNEWGATFGGPIVKDVVHFFLAYDGKDINDSRQVIPLNLDKLPAGLGLVPTLSRQGGSYVDSFNEHLVFGKLDARISDEQKLTISSKLRLESDHIPEDVNLSAPGNDKQKTNNEFRLDGAFESRIGEDWTSDSKAEYQTAVWNPHANLNAPEIRYKVAPSGPGTIDSGADVILTGGSPDSQRRAQSGVLLTEDVTNTGFSSHVFKAGAKLAFMNYDLSGTSRSVDVVQTLIDPSTGLPFYDAATGNCTGTNVINGGNNSDQCKIDRALAPTAVSLNNTQIGLYIQDDWDVIHQLQLNLGVRWDVETNMLDNSYVTPADRVAVLNAPDTRTFAGQTAAPGQTYAQSLAKGGININDYIATGSARKAYLGAFAPRAGFSYDIFDNRSTVVFGGWGRSYDRTMANNALDEKQKNLAPNGEIWLIRNDFKMPYTDQYSVGVRQGVFNWNFEAAVSELDGKNQFQWFSGNRDLNGGFATQSSIDPLWGGPAGYGSLILGDFIGETRTRQLMLKAEKPYARESPWTLIVSYTYSDAETKHREWNDDIFDWTYGRSSGDRPWNPSRLIDKHRLVAVAMADVPFGFTVSGRFTYGSGQPRRIIGCPYVGDNPCDISHGGATAWEGFATPFRQLDLGIQKRFGAGPGAFVIRADMLNVFNTANLLYQDDTWGGVGAKAGTPANRYGTDNLTVDAATGVRGPMRLFKLTGSYTF